MQYHSLLQLQQRCIYNTVRYWSHSDDCIATSLLILSQYDSHYTVYLLIEADVIRYPLSLTYAHTALIYYTVVTYICLTSTYVTGD